MRRLLTAREVCAKLGGQQLKWLDEHQAALYDDRFPRPVLPEDKFGSARWDEGAIDAWLDSKMDPALRPPPLQTVEMPKDWNSILEQRLGSAA